MDPLQTWFHPRELHCSKSNHFWTSTMITLWTLQSLTMPFGSSTSLVANRISREDKQYRQIPSLQLLLTTVAHGEDELELTHDKRFCEGCKLDENGRMCAGSEHGECYCSTSGNAICHCKAEWTGDTCQYQLSKISCEKMRNCILCLVYKSGPLTEGNDCNFFCRKNYPAPLVVRNLHFQDDEHLCSFIHQHEKSAFDCRYFFKYGQITPEGIVSSKNFYVIAQQDMDCGTPVRFPVLRKTALNQRNNDSFELFAKSYEEAVNHSESGNAKTDGATSKNNFFVLVIIFSFLALPIVTCIFAIIYNFTSLPCGLCNVFRQPSSKYIRNLRPFPGFVPTEESMF